jgi:predicted SprT family Zn-dependent metalloprotease
MGMVTWVGRLETWFDEACAEATRRGLKLRTPDGRSFGFNDITWKVSPRQTRKAGVCWEVRRVIWLNGHMTEEHARSTFLHELAHLFSHWYEPRTVHTAMGSFNQSWHHGPVFKKWARAMGDSGDRCHSYPEIMAVKRGDWAHCSRCSLEFKKQWRNGDPTLYHCRKCKTPIRPGRLTPAAGFAKAVAMQPAHVPDASDPRGDLEVLLFDLAALKEGGMASSPRAKAIRRQLRRLGHTGGARG